MAGVYSGNLRNASFSDSSGTNIHNTGILKNGARRTKAESSKNVTKEHSISAKVPGPHGGKNSHS